MTSPRKEGSAIPCTARPSPPTAHSPCVVDLLSDSDTAPSPNPRGIAACRPTAGPATAAQQPAGAPNHSTAADAAIRRNSIDLALANMVDLLSDDDDDDAIGGEDRHRGTEVAFAGPSTEPVPRRSTSARRIRKPARFTDTDDAEPASPRVMRGSAERADRGPNGDGGGAYQWPSPPEDSFIDDGPAESLSVSACDFPDPSPPAKRCGQQSRACGTPCRALCRACLLSCLGCFEGLSYTGKQGDTAQVQSWGQSEQEEEGSAAGRGGAGGEGTRAGAEGAGEGRGQGGGKGGQRGGQAGAAAAEVWHSDETYALAACCDFKMAWLLVTAGMTTERSLGLRLYAVSVS
jgi:hypothetical protein